MFEIYWFLSLYRWIWCISHQKFLVIKGTFHIDFKRDKTFIKTYENIFLLFDFTSSSTGKLTSFFLAKTEALTFD